MQKNNSSVIIISIVYFIISIVSIIYGIFLFALFLTLNFKLTGSLHLFGSLNPFIALIKPSMLIFPLIIYLFFGIFWMTIGFGLLKNKHWAKKLGIIISIMGIVVSAYLLFSNEIKTGIFGIIINLFFCLLIIFALKN